MSSAATGRHPSPILGDLPGSGLVINELLRCAQRGADPFAYTGNSDSVLMGHMRQKTWEPATVARKCRPAATA